MHIARLVRKKILDSQLDRGKAILVYGARQTGKTTLLKSLADELPSEVLSLNCDLDRDRDMLSTESVQAQASVWKDFKFIFIDEAQRKKNIGLVLKIAIDNFPEKNFIATGSSSLDLSNEVSEPLTGRTFTNYLYPISLAELLQEKSIPEVQRERDALLRYGAYPAVITQPLPAQREQILFDLSRDYLYKDVLEYQDIRKPDVIPKLLKLLAYQVGNEVSFHELAKTLGIDQQTVQNYVDLLEKSFVIFRLPPFSKNLRSEINTKEKIYFCDLGIRNAVIGDFNDLSLRSDRGALWENFVIVERMKKRHYGEISAQHFFWRTYQQAEVDLVENRNGALFAYEIKYAEKKAKKAPKSWISAYPEASWETINGGNYLEFLS